MTSTQAALRALLLATASAGAIALPLQPAAAQLAVFDGTNYAQNLLQAARALQQINNQLTSLQNQASMLQDMGRNLQSVDFPQLQRITAAMQRIDALMSKAQAIQFKVRGLDQQIRTAFPGSVAKALSSDQQVVQARTQLDAATDAYRQAMTVQAQVAENVQQDAGVLNELAATSQGAVGALQVGQATNQLIALSVKQQLQLQNLMASNYRESAIERARQAQAEADGRAMTRRFLDGPAPN